MIYLPHTQKKKFSMWQYCNFDTKNLGSDDVIGPHISLLLLIPTRSTACDMTTTTSGYERLVTSGLQKKKIRIEL